LLKSARIGLKNISKLKCGPNHNQRSKAKGNRITGKCDAIASNPALNDPTTPGGGGRDSRVDLSITI
jgi:hypothetical protein